MPPGPHQGPARRGTGRPRLHLHQDRPPDGCAGESFRVLDLWAALAFRVSGSESLNPDRSKHVTGATARWWCQCCRGACRRLLRALVVVAPGPSTKHPQSRFRGGISLNFYCCCVIRQHWWQYPRVHLPSLRAHAQVSLLLHPTPHSRPTAGGTAARECSVQSRAAAVLCEVIGEPIKRLALVIGEPIKLTGTWAL